MQEHDVKTILLRELPELIEHDPQIRDTIWRLVMPYVVPRQETESRFDRMLNELQRMREESERKWAEEKAESARKWAEEKAESARKWAEEKAESARKWEEQQRKWEANQAELQRMREESERKWAEEKAESARKWEEQQRKWEANQAELQRMREESERRWEEHQRKLEEHEHRFQQMLAEIKRVDTKIDSKIGALGARWGIDSETSFRNALRGILEEVAQVQVLHINDFDDTGEVFGRPDLIELDIVIQNGMLMVCEIKSSISRSEVHVFERKVHFYERRHQRTAAQKVIISPMVDPRAMSLIEQLGIRLYSNADDVVFDKSGTTTE